jgi:hypothetical protein
MNRRAFLEAAGTIGVAPLVVTGSGGGELQAQGAGALAADRGYWVAVLTRLADPVLKNLAAGTLKTQMPVEQATGANRAPFSHLEALGRLLAGMAPWLDLPADDTPEGKLRAQYGDLARRAIARAVDPASPDFLNFTGRGQPLVDAAFLAQGVLRAPRALRESLAATTRKNLVAALESTRGTTPGFNNWLLFSATVEAALSRLGATWDRMRVDYALRQHEQWYKGDGIYGDGPTFHWDYYNSFVIQPMLLDVLDVCRDELPAWKDMATRVEPRARRYAAILERLIAPDGSFPPIGRSIAYRFGAFQLLAQMALRKSLPEEITAPQVRGALSAIIKRSIEMPGTFDSNGWLQIGFAGHQPGVGETYISTGSVYLCAVGLLPLGLPASDPFWSAPAEPWTSVRAWSGQPFPIDKAIST